MNDQTVTYSAGIDSYLSTLLLSAITVVSAALLWRVRKTKLKLPPGPWCLPIVGYLPFLGKEPFRTLDDLSKKYGNIFSLYMGRTYVVILGDYAAVKEALSKWETTDRPPELFSFIPNGVGLSSVNGQEWVEQRRFTVKIMRNLGNARSPWVRFVEDEVSNFVQLIKGYDGKPLNVHQLFTSTISNNIASFVFGKRFPATHSDRKLWDHGMDDTLNVLGQAGIHAHFPWLIKIFVKLHIGGYHKSFELAKDFNNFIRKEIKSHKEMKERLAKGFVNAYLEEMEVQQKKDANTTYNEGNLIGNTQALFLGGSDTTKTSLMWLLLAMAAYSDVQDKVHAELDSVLQEGQRVSWDDRSNLPYTYAVMMESNRWRTNAPLNTSRLTREDITLGNYRIPKGTTIIGNNWALHNDTRYWKDPENFIPERFLQNGGNEINFRPESYVPFSYGKRKCPGESMATMEMFLYFAALLKMFEVRSPGGNCPCLNGVLGLAYKPVQKELCFIPRFSQSKQ